MMKLKPVLSACLFVAFFSVHALAQSSLPLSFEEGFENGMKQWRFTEESNWSIQEIDGNHVLTINKRESSYKPKHRSPFHIALVKDRRYGDFELTFKVQSPEDTGAHRDCAVFWGYQDPEHFYYVHLGKKPDAVSGQIMIVNDAPRVKISENKNPIPWTDDWHTVKVRRVGATGEVFVYFDDMSTPVMSVVDKTFGAGLIGIGSFDDRDYFDDVKIYGTAE